MAACVTSCVIIWGVECLVWLVLRQVAAQRSRVGYRLGPVAIWRCCTKAAAHPYPVAPQLSSNTLDTFAAFAPSQADLQQLGDFDFQRSRSGPCSIRWSALFGVVVGLVLSSLLSPRASVAVPLPALAPGGFSLQQPNGL